MMPAEGTVPNSHHATARGSDVAGTPLLGRVAERDALVAAVDALVAGAGGLAVVVAEAGLGKTRLLDEVAAIAARRGVAVVRGDAGGDDAPPPHAPWPDVLRQLAALVPGDVRPRGALDHLEGRTAAPELLAPSALEAERRRRELGADVAAAVLAAARTRPLLLLVDDLHEAGRGALLLLEAVAAVVAAAPVLLVVSRRPGDPRLAQHGQPVFDALDRRGEPIVLSPWGADATAAAVAAVLGRSAPPRLVEVIAGASGGNPLFVLGFARLVHAHADVDLLDGFPVGVRVPDGLRALLRQQLHALPAAVREVLAAAAILGVRVDLATVAAVAERPTAAVRAALAAAASAGLVAVDADHVAFLHPLGREAARADVDAAEVHALHGRAAGVLAATAADAKAAAVAHHLLACGRADAVPAAIAAARHAAAIAARACAWDEAVAWLRRALAALPEETAGDDETRIDLLTDLAAAHLRDGNPQRAREAAARAALAARDRGDATRLANAALACGAGSFGQAGVDPEQTGWLEECAPGLVRRRSALGAIAAARLAVQLSAPADQTRRAALCQDALDAARLSGSDEALAHALDARHQALWHRNDAAGQVLLAEQVAALGADLDHRELQLHGRLLLLRDRLEAGDLGGFAAGLEDATQLAADPPRDGASRRLALLRVTGRVLLGDLDGAARLAAAAPEDERIAESPAEAQARALQLAMLDHLRGEAGTGAVAVRELLEAFPAFVPLRVVQAVLDLDAGRRDEAAAGLARAAARGFADLALDEDWLFTVASAAEVCAGLGDIRPAPRLVELLAPYAGRVAVSAGGVAVAGSVARPLGLLAAVLGDAAAARMHLDAAVALERGMGAIAFAARSERDRVRLG